MANFIKKQSLSEKRKTPAWTFRQMIETMSKKPYEQVVKEQKGKHTYENNR